jgi:hypothetical protein
MTFIGRVEEERITARHEDMDRTVKEEVKNTSANKEGQIAAASRTREPTFVGSIHTGCAFLIICRDQYHQFQTLAPSLQQRKPFGSPMSFAINIKF